MATRYAFAIDLDRCIGCRACVVSCNAGNDLPPSSSCIEIEDVVQRRENGLWGSFAHHRCFHCEAAPCVAVCPTGTLSKWNGLTAVAPESCSGCRYCTDACPFGIPRPEHSPIVKCVGCVDLVREGRASWCEQTCPSQAIRFGEREPLLAEARARVQELRGRYPEANLYGETQLGGLGLLLILLDRPEVYGLPSNPVTPRVLKAWQTVQPVATGLSAGAAVAMGVMFMVARRRHVREHEAAGPGAERSGVAAPLDAPSKDGGGASGSDS
jgi:formate dehydrogenase iron-sulfur subunit